MIIDLHVHECLYSGCADMTLEEAVESAIHHGLDGICITDHNSMEIQNDAADYLRSVDFPVFIGVEVDTEDGHIIAFGLDPKTKFRPYPFLDPTQRLINLVNAQGGFCFAAHPFRFPAPEEGYYLDSVQGLHGIEVYNGGNSRPESNNMAKDACSRLKLIPVAGSDAHIGNELGAYATWFPGIIHDTAGLVAALKSGKGRPVMRKGIRDYTFHVKARRRVYIMGYDL